MFFFSFLFLSLLLHPYLQKYKNSKKQINKHYIKITIIALKQSEIYRAPPEQCREHLLGIWKLARVPPRATATGGASPHAPPLENRNKLVDPTRLHLLFPPTLAVRNNITCKEEKDAIQLVLFHFFHFFLVSDLFHGSVYS